MDVQKPKPENNRRGFSCLGCLALILGCGFITVLALAAALFLFRDQLVGVGLQAAGFENEGNTEAYLARNVPIIPTAPPLVNATEPLTYTLRAEGTSSQPIQNNRGVIVAAGSSSEGDVVTMTTTEQEILSLCMEYSNVCGPTGERSGEFIVSNLRAELVPGAAIVRIDAETDRLPVTQSVGLVLQVSPTGDNVILRGVDIGGRLYAEPPAEFEDVILDIEQEIQSIIQSGSVVVEGQEYALDRLIIEDGSATALLK